MTNVLLIAASAPHRSVLAASLRQLREKGARTYLVAAADKEDMAGLDLDGLCLLPEDVADAAHHRSELDALPAERVWRRVRTSAWIRQRARQADVLVAVDAKAVYAVWRFAQRHPHADAQYGVASALRAVDARGQRRRRLTNSIPTGRLAVENVNRLVRSTPRAVVWAVTSRPVMRSTVGSRLWRTAVTAPGLPDRVRSTVARQVASAMSWAERPDSAAQLLRSAAGRMGGLGRRATVLADAAKEELAAGFATDTVGVAVTTLLAAADQKHRAGKARAAVQLIHQALLLHFHRVLHIDQLTTPLAEDPESYVAPFRRSLAASAAASPQGRTIPPAPFPAARALRLLIVTNANDSFLKPIQSYYAHHPRVQLRFLDVAEWPPLKAQARSAGRFMLAQRLTGNPAPGTKVEALVRPLLDWADTVFIDWCVAQAALFTLIDPGSTRIIVRLHSYEAFSRWSHIVDFSRVDDIVFVAKHIRDLATAVVPQLRANAAPRMHVLHNALDLRVFQSEKQKEARFNLGLVGIGQVAKDPRWAVAVLRLLRARDPRYRLLLLGGDMKPEASVAARNYLAAFNEDLRELETAAAVRRLGHSDDIPKALTEVGVILSSSVREGSHCAIMEGAASGAVPIVRDWPFFAGKPNGARTMFPRDWVVSTPQEAAEKILAATADEKTWLEAGRRASEYALAEWDWSVVRHDFDRLLFEQG